MNNMELDFEQKIRDMEAEHKSEIDKLSQELIKEQQNAETCLQKTKQIAEELKVTT